MDVQDCDDFAGAFAVAFIGFAFSMFTFIISVPFFDWSLSDSSNQSMMDDMLPDPCIARTMNHLLWVLYPILFLDPFDAMWIAYVNAIGLVFNLHDLLIFVVHGNSCQQKRLRWSGVFHLLLLLGLVAYLASPSSATITRSSDDIVGIFCVMYGVVMCQAPHLPRMWEVITKTKNTQPMPPFFLEICIFVNGCLWTWYGLIQSVTYFWIANGIEALVALVYLLLFKCYWGEEDDKLYGPYQLGEEEDDKLYGLDYQLGEEEDSKRRLQTLQVRNDIRQCDAV